MSGIVQWRSESGFHRHQEERGAASEGFVDDETAWKAEDIGRIKVRIPVEVIYFNLEWKVCVR